MPDVGQPRPTPSAPTVATGADRVQQRLIPACLGAIDRNLAQMRAVYEKWTPAALEAELDGREAGLAAAVRAWYNECKTSLDTHATNLPQITTPVPDLPS